MPRVRLFGYLALAGIVAFAFVAPARGDKDAPAAGGKAAPAGVRVKVEKADGTKLEGTLGGGPLHVITEFGTADVDPGKVREISFSAGSDGVEMTVELADKSEMSGKPGFATLAITTDAGAVESLSPGAIQQLKVVRPADGSILGFAVALVVLTAMEIVLGIDNIIFLAIVAGRLPQERQSQARRIGLAAALGTRLALLFSLSFLLGLTKPWFTLPFAGLPPAVRDISGRDMILLLGGAFLIYKSVKEMHEKLEEAKADGAAAGEKAAPRKKAGFARTILVIASIDIVFSLDSVITAVGMVDDLTVMVTAMILAMLVMLVFAGPISRFVDRHPTVKMLALSFLILIGVMLVAEGFGQHVNKGYIYFAMGFAVLLEFINMRLRGGPAPDVAHASSG